MLPEPLLRGAVRDGRITPRFLYAPDHGWLAALLAEVARLAGRPWRDLAARLRAPLAPGVPAGAQALALHVLSHRSPPLAPAVTPPRARAAAFGQAARRDLPPRDRDAVLAAAAASLGVSPETLEESLLADFPGERPVRPLDPSLAPADLAREVNLTLAQGFLARAVLVRIEAEGNACALARLAQALGLMATISPRWPAAPVSPARTAGARDADPATDALDLELPGPLALFRRAPFYARALARLLPHGAACDRFVLYADCVVRGAPALLTLATGMPLFPPAAPPPPVNRLAERLARALARHAPSWEVSLDPDPIEAAGTLSFADLSVRPPGGAERRPVEIAGFWTPDHLATKLARYRAAGRSPILLVDAERACADDELPPGAPVLRFRRSLPTLALLAALDPTPPSSRSSSDLRLRA